MGSKTALKNDRDTILAVVGEHYLESAVRKAKIRKMAEAIPAKTGAAESVDGVWERLNVIEHGAWVFAYDAAKNVVYLVL